MDRQKLGVVLVVTILGLGATQPARAANWAEGLFAEQSHDFGPVPRGAKVHHPFVLANRLAEPITIVNLRASCGCTTGKASASVVRPGQTAFIDAEMDTKNFAGQKSTALFITLVDSSGREAEVRLGVSSTILSDLVLNPGTIDFGTVERGQTPQRVLTVDRLGPASWQVERMVSACKAIDANLEETSRAGGMVQYTLTVRLKPDAPAGALRDEIRILTNDRETPTIAIPLTAQIRGELAASPSVLSLGKVVSSGGAQGQYWLRASKPFAVKSVEGIGDGFALATDNSDRKLMHKVTVTYRPEEGRSRGDLRHTFRFHSDLPGEPPVEVMAVVRVEP